MNLISDSGKILEVQKLAVPVVVVVENIFLCDRRRRVANAF
jgi:hypothetical protein